MRVLLIAAIFSTAAWSQTIPARAKPSEYAVHATAGKLTLAADYMVHSLAARGKTFFVNDYLIIETAVFPGGVPVMISSGHFTLRLNGKKLLLAQTPSMVGASLKYPDWEQRGTLEGSAGVGDSGVILGRPPAVERFPGDPRARRGPAPPRAPDPDHQQRTVEQQPVRPHELAIDAALPEGETKHPVAGFLYFAHKGKTSGLKSIELLYQGPSGTTVLRLL